MSFLRRARAQALNVSLRIAGGYSAHHELLAEFVTDQGWARRELDTAIEDLVDTGIATVDGEDGCVVVALKADSELEMAA